MSPWLLGLLPLAVQSALPWARSLTPQERLSYCHQVGEVLAGQGDALLFKVKPKKGFALGTKAVFVEVARAIACVQVETPYNLQYIEREWGIRFLPEAP